MVRTPMLSGANTPDALQAEAGSLRHPLQPDNWQVQAQQHPSLFHVKALFLTVVSQPMRMTGIRM